jgi:hypothetical protein
MKASCTPLLKEKQNVIEEAGKQDCLQISPEQIGKATTSAGPCPAMAVIGRKKQTISRK